MLPIEMHNLRVVSSLEESETILRRELLRCESAQRLFPVLLEALTTEHAVIAIGGTGAPLLYMSDDTSEVWLKFAPDGLQRLR